MTQQPMTYHIVITSCLNQLLHYLFILLCLCLANEIWTYGSECSNLKVLSK